MRHDLSKRARHPFNACMARPFNAWHDLSTRAWHDDDRRFGWRCPTPPREAPQASPQPANGDLRGADGPARRPPPSARQPATNRERANLGGDGIDRGPASVAVQRPLRASPDGANRRPANTLANSTRASRERRALATTITSRDLRGGMGRWDLGPRETA